METGPRPTRPKAGDRVWFLGEDKELQGDLKITVVRVDLAVVTVKPVDDNDSWNNGYVVWLKDLTYIKPTLPEESYLYP